jgi:hypothetical protein
MTFMITEGSEAAGRGDVVAFVGAGLSKAAGR